jgi:hypothetical protein
MNGRVLAPRARRAAPAVLLVLVAGLLLSGCRQIEEASAATYQPAKVTEVANLDVKQVQFTATGAEQVDLQTEAARRDGRYTVVPHTALIYDGQGVPWVYTVTAPLTFLRAKVGVDRVVGDRALLSSGLSAGTEVVTVGATQVYGAELGIGESH